jgi:hypothetical protein
MHLRNDAGVHPVTQAFYAAAGESGERFDILNLRRAQSCDAAIRQVSLIVEGAGIAEIARRPQLG